MKGILLFHNSWEEGVFNYMKNYFLYLALSTKMENESNFKDILYFKNKRIVAVDRNTYNKNDRLNLQQSYKFMPFSVNQRVFKSLLSYAAESPGEIIIKNIEFFDETIEDSSEYDDIQNDLSKMDYNNILEKVLYILEEFDTEIYSILLSYKGYDFYLSGEGVMDTNAPDDILFNFTGDEKVSNTLLL